ncbi:Uncharacterized protein OBRU01_17837 [Operophtera brumata]|uniref:Uncharacterized protein n=1 Tax=Operophtera brumata TaxID=104452 RepID=A0A0L7L032_OPEBR|nr:Uncharacterized protein OBRU01_17837 [Operophtera brumata]
MAYTSNLLVVVLGIVTQCYGQNSYYFENHKYCDDLSPAYGDINLDQIAVRASNVNYCQNLHPTHDFDEEALLGMWFIREYIYHKEKGTKTEYSPYCPIIQIRKFEDYVQGGLISRSLPTPPTPYPQLTNSPYISRTYGLPEQYRIRHFVLEWHEGLWHDDYHVKVNTSHKGFWPTDKHVLFNSEL